MKKIAPLCALLFIVTIPSFSQIVRPDAVVDLTTAGFRELPLRPTTIESVYLTDNWVAGTVVLKPDYKLEDVMMKYDIKNNVLELYTLSEIKIAPVARLLSFKYFEKLEKHFYIDAEHLNIMGLTGLVDEVVKGKASLYVKPYLKKIPSNYNPALNVGDPSDKFKVEETLFLVINQTAYDITRSGKKMLPYFCDKSAVIESYAKQNKLSYKEKNDIIKIVEEFNRN